MHRRSFDVTKRSWKLEAAWHCSGEADVVDVVPHIMGEIVVIFPKKYFI